MQAKENSADILQRERLERESALSPKSRICDIVIIAVFCLFIGGFALLHLITPDREYSEKENRMLQGFPKFSAGALFSGDFASDMTEYLSDQFPLRDMFVTLKAGTERAALRMENGGIMFGDDALTARIDRPDTENLQINLSAAEKFTAAVEKAGIPTVFAPAGRRVDVCGKDIPSLYGNGLQNSLWQAVDSAGKSFAGEYVNLKDSLRIFAMLGEDMYYRTDHHWTSYGAYTAYSALWDSLPDSVTGGADCRASSEFTREAVTDSFYGTSYSASGAAWITPDTIELWRFDGDSEIPVTNKDRGEVYEGLYRTEYLSERDKYSVFLGENTGRLDIGYFDGSGDRKVLLIIKDSFAQSLVPFLAADFDIIMIDPRYYSDSIYRTVAEISPDGVIILMNVDTMTTLPVLRQLLRGIEQ